jgi:hypothetical protein
MMVEPVRSRKMKRRFLQRTIKQDVLSFQPQGAVSGAYERPHD